MKTLAVRIEDDQHARLTLLSRLSSASVTDTIRTAIETHLDALAADPSISAKAEALAAEIQNEAALQQQALAGLISPAARPTPNKSTTTQRGSSRSKE